MKESNEVAVSCRAIREKLNETLAAGEAKPLDRGALLHLQACDECRGHYNAQAKLYGAIDSGVRRLVESVAPPSLLPGVRERLTAAERRPNRAWVRALLRSSVALLVACGLLLVMVSDKHKIQETRVASFQTPPTEQSSQSDLVALSNRPPTSRGRVQRPVCSSTDVAPVVFDRQETEGFAHLVSGIGKDPELGLILLHGAALLSDQPAAIQPLSIAKIEIQGLGEENR